MTEKVIAKLDELRAMLQADGGDLEFIDMEGKVVHVRLRGACGSCPHAMITLKNYVETSLRQTIDPEITVERVM